MQQIIFAKKLFTGDGWLYNYEVLIDNGIIQSLQPANSNATDTYGVDTFLAPAFIDFQVYGAAGKLLAMYPFAETLQTMFEVFSKEGTCLFQPTIATNTIEVFKSCINAVKSYWQQGGKGVCGLHLEGPWIHPLRRGAHIERLIHSPTIEEVEELLAYGKDVIKTITLAPEVCSNEVIECIRAYNIILSAGHSNATYEDATKSFDKGITTVTHLFNAMSPLHHRQPGLVGATLHHTEVMASIIPDGHHVAFAAISLAKRLMGCRLFAITDAVTETKDGPYQHHRVGNKYECNGVLSGSAISMYDAFCNLVHFAGIEVEDALRMCSFYPAKALCLDSFYGKIAPGYAAQFVVLDKQLDLADVITW